MAAPVIALLTDFGTQDIYVGVLKGILNRLAPQSKLIDLAHGVPRGNVPAGALMLWQAVPYFPPQTIFLCVVDPGVGTERRGIAAIWEQLIYVGPDNGLISYLIERFGKPIAYQLEDQIPASSATFHGRDLFAPAAGRLAGGLPAHELGPQTSDLVRLAKPRLALRGPGAIEGEVLHIDPFGNLVTSIGLLEQSKGRLVLRPWVGDPSAVEMDGSQHAVSLPEGQQLALHRTFSEVEPGAGLAYIGSSGLLEIAINQGDAASEFSLAAGNVIQLYAKG